jgi:hypothetical protein
MLKKHMNKSLSNHELKILHEAQFPGEANTHSATQEIPTFYRSENSLSFFYRCTVHLFNIKIPFFNNNAPFIEHIKC